MTHIPLDSEEQLITLLKDDLGYCPCMYEDSLSFLHDLLTLARDRTDATNNSAQFSEISRAIDDFLPLQASSGLASWMIVLLEKHGYIWHGFNITDIWINPKGRQVLEALEVYLA